jgi:galactose mutarotase-like enzyme
MDSNVKEYKIESQFLEAKISSQGAEVTSLYDKELRVEYLWQRNEKYWEYSAPIFFPIVGKLNNDHFRVGRKDFYMRRHGLARDHNFELVRHEHDVLVMRLKSSDETRRVFPYKFFMEVTYKLYGPVLTVAHEIKCPEKRDLFFSFGAQTALNIPLKEGDFSDYYIDFEYNEYSGPFYLHHELVDFDQKPDLGVFSGRRLPLSEKLFEHGALIFKDVRSQKLTLRNTFNDQEIVFDMGEAPYLGLWKPRGASFVAFGPWYGVPDVLGAGDDFLKKEGVIHLEVGEVFKSSYSIHLK